MFKGMKIESIDVFKADLALREPFRIAIMEIEHANNVYVRINAEGGLHGMGEASPFWKICGETQAIDLAAARDLALLIKGKNALAIEERIADLEGYLSHNSTIRSAFDMALYDLLGKATGMPLYALLGGERRQLRTDLTISINDPSYMAERASEFVAAGFSAIKVKLGTTYAEDLERIVSIREAVGGDVPIRIDANQGWDFTTALAILRALEPMGIEYCEQPVACWDHAALSELRRGTSIPIMADESLFDHHDAYKLCCGECCDYLNIKLSKSGGIRNALNICAVAEGCGKACMVGCMMESRLGLSAAAHLASARGNIIFYDLDSALLLAEDPVTGGIEYAGEMVTIPDAPGLGADVDSGFLDSMESFTV